MLFGNKEDTVVDFNKFTINEIQVAINQMKKANILVTYTTNNINCDRSGMIIMSKDPQMKKLEDYKVTVIINNLVHIFTFKFIRYINNSNR